MEITVVKVEKIEIDGLPYIKKTYSNGTVTTELNVPVQEPLPEPEQEPEIWVKGSELDAAYREGVNEYGGVE